MESKELLDLILKSNELKEFGYIKEWYNEWKTIVEKFSYNALYITKGKEHLESNFFKDTIKISGQDVQLIFNIEYFNALFRNHPEIFEQYSVDIDDINLKCAEYEVIYEDFLATEKVLKNDTLPIYIVPWLTMNKICFNVVDGNHRVCAAINEKRKNIKVYSANMYLTALAGATINDCLNYLILCDVQRMITLQEHYKNASQIYSQSLVFNPSANTTINTLLKRFNSK